MSGPWEKFAEPDGPWKKFDRRKSAAQQIEGDEITKGAKNFNADTGFLQNAAAGAGKAVYDTARGLGQMVGLVSSDDVKATRERDKALMDTGGGLVGNIAGNVGMALLPGAALKGAATAARAIPAAAEYAPMLSAAGSTLMAPKTIPTALAVGGAQGLIQPAENLGERAFNTGLGAAATAAVPALGALKAASEPFYESGRQAIIGRTLKDAAGGEADNVAAALANARELVPGSMPTAGQAANNAGIAALERAAFAAEPTVTVPVAERMASQNAARVNLLRDMAGEGGARELAAAERAGTADDLYKQAYERGVNMTRNASSGQFLTKGQVAGRQGEITKLLRTPAIQQAVKDARALASNEMVNIKNPAGSVQGLDYVKRALDDQISKSTGNEARVLQGLKERLLTTIDTLSPEYAAARNVFADMSKPVNQFDTAAEIAKRSIRPLDDQLMPGAYARALRDETAQSATGFRKATLEGTFEPEQLAKLNAIKDDLARAEFAKNAGRGVGSDTVQKLAYNNLMNQTGLNNLPNLLSRPVQMLEYGSRAIYGSANKEMQRKLAEALLNPQEAAQFMASATPSQKAKLAADLLRYTATPPLMATPGLINANQQ